VTTAGRAAAPVSDPFGCDWYTAADQAELDVLVWALVYGYFEHRERCGRCVGPEPCPHVQAAIREVVDWRDARALLSRAEALRAEQRRLAAV
jgi:hypothetical protein